MFIEGFPLKGKTKLILLAIFFSLAIINTSLRHFNSVFNYAYVDYVTITFLILAVVISIGNYLTEALVIGMSIFIIMSTIYDLNVWDITPLRKNLLLGSLGILLFSLVLGKISFAHLGKIIRNQLGAK